MVPQPPTTKAQVIALADAHHASWPQYVGHWDGPEWQPVTIKRRVRTKLGIAFEPGDFTIMRWDAAHPKDTVLGYWMAYSWRNGIDTAVRREHFAQES